MKYTIATLSMALFAHIGAAQVTPQPIESGQVPGTVQPGTAQPGTTQPGTTQPGTVQPGEVQPGNEAAALTAPYRAKQLIGSKVYIQNNTAVGTIDDIVLSDQGMVEYLIAESNNQYFTVPFSAVKLDIEQRTATMNNITPQTFQTIPTYRADNYPNYFDPTYRTSTYRYYNLTPRPLQRLRDRVEDRINPRNP